MNIKLSVLDQTPIRKNETAADSLAESLELAALTDKLGYTRYWLSEHHNTLTLANAAPEILLARLGAVTQNIRLGSGGIMLPNHSSLKMAENFRLLEALYPNRIDMGIGRAPGTDRATAQLLNPSNTFNPQEYVQQLKELQAFFSNDPISENMFGKIRAIPNVETQPVMWALTSSGESAYIAAHFGMGLSYAQFINPIGGAQAIREYEARFMPSQQLAAPISNVGIFAFCSESEQKVQEAIALMQYRFLSFEKGEFDKFYSYNDIKDYEYTEGEKQRLLFHQNRFIAGTPQTIKPQLEQLARQMGTNEIVIATFADSREDRLTSYELLAKIFINPANPLKEL